MFVSSTKYSSSLLDGISHRNKILQLVGGWSSYVPYPLLVGESQGIVMNKKDLVIFSGFWNGFGKATSKVYAYDTSANSTASKSVWREMQNVPIPSGLTHAAFALNSNLNNSVLYFCGGYVGPHPGGATNVCMTYKHNAPNGSQWSFLPSLPAVRAGGGMLYNAASNSLLYTSGSSRPSQTDRKYTIDHNETWELYLSQLSNGWIPKMPFPHAANHVGSVTILYKGQYEKHFVLGGQHSEDEKNGNKASVFEWDATTEKWTPRASLQIPRGHFASSTVPYKQCGIIIAGGAMNKAKKTGDISYYEIETDSWHSIGSLPAGLNSPVCGIGADSFFYCETGDVKKKISWRQQII